MLNRKKTILTGLSICWIVFAAFGLLKYYQVGPFSAAVPPDKAVTKQTTTDAEKSTDTDTDTDTEKPTSSLGQAVEKAEQGKYVNDQVKNQLVAQGYPADALDGMLAQGAQKATPLKNIAAVAKSYGTPWSEPLHVGNYTLTGLYLVGNDESHRFVLGQYEDKTGEHVIYLHMSKTEPIETLQAGLVYSHKQAEKHYTAYINDKGNVAGIQFAVELTDGKGVVNYVATTSGTFTQSDIDGFISSVVDGSII